MYRVKRFSAVKEDIKIDTGEMTKFKNALDRMTGGSMDKEFSDNREDVPEDILEKAKKEGVVQKDHNGDWRIVAIKKKKFWASKFSSKEKGEASLRAYHANKRFSDNEEDQNPMQQPPQLTSQELQIENMRMRRELMRNQRLQQEIRAKERQDAIKNQMAAQKNAAEEKDSDEKNTLRAQKAVQGSQDNRPNTGVYKKATIAKAPVSMK